MSDVVKLPYCLKFNERPVSPKLIAKLIQCGSLSASHAHSIEEVRKATERLRARATELLHRKPQRGATQACDKVATRSKILLQHQ
jgi:hypothetical protein